jgi:hypothetical protein
MFSLADRRGTFIHPLAQAGHQIRYLGCEIALLADVFHEVELDHLRLALGL